MVLINNSFPQPTNHSAQSRLITPQHDPITMGYRAQTLPATAEVSDAPPRHRGFHKF